MPTQTQTQTQTLDNFNPDTPLFRLAQDVEDSADYDILEDHCLRDFPEELPDRMTKAEMQEHYALLYECVEKAQEQLDEVADQAYRLNTLGVQ